MTKTESPDRPTNTSKVVEVTPVSSETTHDMQTTHEVDSSLNYSTYFSTSANTRSTYSEEIHTSETHTTEVSTSRISEHTGAVGKTSISKDTENTSNETGSPDVTIALASIGTTTANLSTTFDNTTEEIRASTMTYEETGVSDIPTKESVMVVSTNDHTDGINVTATTPVSTNEQSRGYMNSSTITTSVSPSETSTAIKTNEMTTISVSTDEGITTMATSDRDRTQITDATEVIPKTTAKVETGATFSEANVTAQATTSGSKTQTDLLSTSKTIAYPETTDKVSISDYATDETNTLTIINETTNPVTTHGILDHTILTDGGTTNVSANIPTAPILAINETSTPPGTDTEEPIISRHSTTVTQITGDSLRTGVTTDKLIISDQPTNNTDTTSLYEIETSTVDTATLQELSSAITTTDDDSSSSTIDILKPITSVTKQAQLSTELSTSHSSSYTNATSETNDTTSE